MTRFRHIYLFAVVGLFGGLIAAVIHRLFLVEPMVKAVGTPNLWLWNLALGICIGAPIAFFPRFVESAGHRDWREALRSGLTAAAFGALGGCIAVFCGELLHHLLGGGFLGRMCATALLGIGIACGEIRFTGARGWRALAGGAIGGALAGLFVELLVRQPVPNKDSAIIALLMLGLSIPLAISLSVHIRPEAWLEGVTGGKVARQIFHLGKFNEQDAAIIGSGDGSFIWVRGAEPRHATLYISETGTRLIHTAASGQTRVNGSPITDCVLHSGDEIDIAESIFVYRERTRKEADAPVQPPRVRFVGKGMSVLLMLGAGASAFGAEAEYKATVLGIRSGANSEISGQVLLTDATGKPITATRPVRLTIYENGQKVHERVISEGARSSSVLIIDRSGSMKGLKMQNARQAAATYVQQAPPGHAVMVIAFDARPEIRCGFTSDTALLTKCVGLLAHVTRSKTAFVDAIATGLDALAPREGTHSILALTDGIDNASTKTVEQISTRAQQSRASISIIGLGKDVRSEYLQRFVTAGGRYLPAAAAEDLKALFGEEAQIVAARQPFSYKTPRPYEGTRRIVRAEVTIDNPGGDRHVFGGETDYVSRLFIPGLEGNLNPYMASVGVLLLLPLLATFTAGVFAIWQFRRAQVVPVRAGSALVGIVDRNNCEPTVGDTAVECPSCNRAHHMRSWRNNRCRCMREPNGNGYVCYHRVLPAFLRQWLDKMSGEHSGRDGRKWLCRCAGDPEGY